MATLSGKVIGNYEILEEIGRGAMGVVFKAKQLSMDRVVALKFLPKRMAQDDKRVQRFIREARAAGKLSHPNIVSVHDVGQAAGLHYISMEYVDGASAHTQMKKNGPMKEADAVELGLQIAGALKMAHDNGILHRDVKPDNFLLDSSGRARLADLGLARFETGESDDAHLTQEGTALGTPHYMAPEQARGEKVDHRSDLYSLGASLYVLACGKTPFEGPTAAVILVNVLQKDPPPLRKHNPQLTPGFCAVVEKLMAKSPDARFKDAKAVVEALEQVRAGVYAAPGGSGTGLRRPTTGPLAGVRPTTGPQNPLRSGSTGPMTRVGPRTMATSRARNATGSPALFAGLGIGAAALLLILLFAMGGGGTPARPHNASNDEIPLAAAPVNPARTATKTPAAPISHTAQQTPRPAPTDFAAHNDRPAPAYVPAQPAPQPNAGYARAEEDAKNAFRAGEIAKALDGLNAFAQTNAGSSEGQQARRLNETLSEQAREWAQKRIDEALDAYTAKDFAKAGGTLAFLQQNLPPAMRDELKVGEKLELVQAASAAARRARFGEALKAFEAPALSGQYAKASETAGALRLDAALAGFQKETDSLPDLLDAVKKVDAAALQGLDTLRKVQPDLRIVTLRSGALDGIVTKVDGEKVELRIGSDAGAPVTAFKGGELGYRFRLQLAKQTEPATPADWIARAALYANADALSPGDAAAAKQAVEHAKAHPLAPYYAARLDERARAVDADPARKAWTAIELASEEDLDASKKKDLAEKLAGFEAQHGGSDFAKSKAEQIAALRKRLGAGAAAAQADPKDAAKANAGDAAAGKAELEKKGWKVTGDWANDPKRPGAFHVKGGGKIEWAKADAALQVFVQPAQEGAVGVYVRYDAEALAKFRQSLGGMANFIGGALDEVKDGYGVRVAGGNADVYGPKNPVANVPGRGGRGRGGRGGGFGGDRFQEISETANKMPGKTGDAQAAGGVRVVVAIQGEKLTVQVNGRSMNTGSNTPRAEGGAAIVVEGDADVLIEKQQ